MPFKRTLLEGPAELPPPPDPPPHPGEGSRPPELPVGGLPPATLAPPARHGALGGGHHCLANCETDSLACLLTDGQTEGLLTDSY